MVIEVKTRGRRPKSGGGVFVIILSGLVVAVAALIFVLRSQPSAPLGPRYQPTSFDSVPGWIGADVAGAVAPFARSCTAGDGAMSKDEDWSAPCEAAALLLRAGLTEAAARSFFRTHFTPVAISQVDEERAFWGSLTVERDRGLVTGYFEPIYEAERAPTAEFTQPALDLPENYVSVDLGKFVSDLQGRSISGVVRDGRLSPIGAREDILRDGVRGAEPIAWLRPTDLLFLQIQGSGRLRLPDGASLRIGYAGKNAKPYTAVGRVLVDRGHMKLEDVSMQSIRAWFDANAAEAEGVMNENASWVFFRPLDDLPAPEGGPIGSQGVQLEAMHSVAVDRRHTPLGAPVFVALDGEAADLSGLFIAQDTGGAITGPMRGDLFIGSGPEAGAIAGRLKAEGRFYLLLPHAAAARLAEGA